MLREKPNLESWAASNAIVIPPAKRQKHTIEPDKYSFIFSHSPISMLENLDQNIETLVVCFGDANNLEHQIALFNAIPKSVRVLHFTREVSRELMHKVPQQICRFVLSGAKFSPEFIESIPGHITSISIQKGWSGDDILSADNITHLPESVKKVYFYRKASAVLVAHLPWSVKKVAIHDGVSIDVIKAIPKTVHTVAIHGGDLAQLIRGFPSHI
jgi:hypothetical protein